MTAGYRSGYRSRWGRAGKFNAKKTDYDGQVYDSVGEAGRARELDLLLAAGRLTGWRRGRGWVLVEAHPGGTKRDRITLRPDFEVWTRALPPGADPHDPPGAPDEVEDYKGALRAGVTTTVFRLKARLWAHAYPTIPLYVVDAAGARTRYPPIRTTRRRADRTGRGA